MSSRYLLCSEAPSRWSILRVVPWQLPPIEVASDLEERDARLFAAIMESSPYLAAPRENPPPTRTGFSFWTLEEAGPYCEHLCEACVRRDDYAWLATAELVQLVYAADLLEEEWTREAVRTCAACGRDLDHWIEHELSPKERAEYDYWNPPMPGT